MDVINSEFGLKLLEIAKSSGQPSGVSIFSGPCPTPGCMNFRYFGCDFCPLHQPNPEWLDKATQQFCPNCFDVFFGLTSIKHHCHCCGQVFCGDCADYQLSRAVTMPLQKLTPNHNFLSTLLFQGTRDRRVCMSCASVMHPSIVTKIVLDPIKKMYRHNPLDVVFCFDSTSSMSASIENVERNIDEIVDDIYRHHYVDLRVAGVGYRDFCDKNRLVNIIPFQNHHRKFERMIDHVRAFGGGDIPEALAVGLGVVQTLKWRPFAARLLIVITDAPPHGLPIFKSKDDYPDGDPSGLDPIEVVRSLARDGVVTYTVGIEPVVTSNGTVSFLKALAAAGNGLYLPLRRHHHLHHFVGAAACDLLMQVICAEELRAANALGKTTPAQARVSVVKRIFARLRANAMPQLTLTPTTATTASTTGSPSLQPNPDFSVTDVHREPMTSKAIEIYLDRVNAKPENTFVPTMQVDPPVVATDSSSSS